MADESGDGGGAPSGDAAPAGGWQEPGRVSMPAGATGVSGVPSPSGGVPDTFELVIDGKPEKMTRQQFEHELARVRKSTAAERRFAEAHRTKQEAEALRQRMKDKPWEAMAELGLDPEQLAEQRMLERIQREQMSPEQRALAEERQKREELESRLREREQQEQEVQVAEAARQYQANFLRRAEEALTKAGFALKDAQPGDKRVLWAVRSMAKLQQDALASGAEEPTAEELAAAVLGDADETVAGRLGALDGDPLLDYLEARNPGLSKRVAVAFARRLAGGGQAKAPAPAGLRPVPVKGQPRQSNGQFDRKGPEVYPDRYSWRNGGER